MLNFAKRAINVPDAGIGTITRYASKYKDIISLGQGAPQFPTPEFIYEGIFEQSKSDPMIGMYNNTTDKYQMGLKRLIVLDFERLYGFTPNLDELYLTVGGVGGLFATFMALLESGDEVIYFDPSYPLHLSQFAISEAKPVFVPYQEDDGWRIDINLLKKSITKRTKAIILTNPNNPTGTIATKAEIESIAQIVIENNLFLVLDEAYEFLTFETELFSPLKIPELRKYIIVSKSFSKEYAMTGWRIGYIWTQSDIISIINNIHLYFSINPATISIVAATLALSDQRGRIARQQIIDDITKSRDVICQRLDRVSNIFSYQKPQGAFYVFPKIMIPNINSVDFAKKIIDEVQVITIPGSSMGPSGDGHVRISFAADSGLINKAFDRIDQFARNY